MDKTNQILLVVNPISGGSDKENVIEHVKKEAKRIDKHVTVYTTKGENDKANIVKLLKKNSFEKLLIAGGDGTIKLVVSATMETQEGISLGIIPAGSANGMAVALNLPVDIEKAIAFALKNNSKPVDIVKINDEISIHIADIGINASLVKNYEESNIRGKLGYALKSIPTLINFKEPFQYSIAANGKEKSGKAIMIAFANAEKYGNGAIVNPNGKLDDGKLEILIFKNLQVTKIIKTIFNKIPIDDDFVEIITTNKATITSKKQVPLQIDGEYCNETDFIEITMADKQARIIY